VPRGEIITVLGPVPSGTLGPTLPHEHILCDLTPLALRDPAIRDTEITLANRHAVDYRPLDYKGNHRLDLREIALREIAAFKAAGGGTILDLTTGGIAPDPIGLRDIARATGVHIVLGAGFYTAEFVDSQTRARPVEWLTDRIEEQLAAGAWGTDIRCGLIGEVGCAWPLADFERRSLIAAARAQKRTGAAINVHPGRHPDAPHEILDVLDAAGADISRVAISHVDRTYFDYPSIKRLAERGCWIEIDFFGIETSNYWFGGADLPTDWMRIRYLRQAMDDGFGPKLLLSHDICTRTRLAGFGGHGYGHLIANVVPLMRDRGFTAAEIDGLMRDNPRRFLTRE